MEEGLPVMRGTLDLLVLKALSWSPMHGFEVTKWVDERSRASLALDDSAVYQALYRMEQRGLVLAEWGTTENNRKARYYKLTPAGKTYLTAETKKLVRYSEALTAILTERKQT